MTKFWPISSPTACPLKWNWSTLYLNTGTTASCHRTIHVPITPENFDEFHNLPKKINDRERMLQGLWPAESMPASPDRPFNDLILQQPNVGCTYCKGLEDKGGMSDRTHNLVEMERHREHYGQGVPKELFTDPTATHVTPTVIEVYFNNICNMSFERN